MQNTYSLKKNSQFRLVYNRGKSLADKYLVMYALRNKEGVNRLGLSVSKKVGKSVLRNRIRRLIKESYRIIEKEGAMSKLGMGLGYDIVVIARQKSAEFSFLEAYISVGSLLKRHGLIDSFNARR